MSDYWAIICLFIGVCLISYYFSNSYLLPSNLARTLNVYPRSLFGNVSGKESRLRAEDNEGWETR
ncbi:hypothetical protein BN77_0640 [Rhizobium mesoamericanum STM3625]|uniref:Transmembrane protein n=1 Tax=Rhizobium mesoamericanum STM3625 TaxID=1211777 RepID=K0Q130_9HYPH|nr:hypothetical protein BN77_0640 [Rhizobium mesoamericanum STM3625]